MEKLGVKVFVLPISGIEVGTKRDLYNFFPHFPKYFFYFLKTIFRLKKEKIDLVFIQSNTDKLILTPIFKIFRLPVIWLEHGPFFAYKRSRIICFWYKFMNRITDKVITVSKDSQADLLKGGIKKVSCVRTGVEMRSFKKSKKVRGLIVGYTGAICWEKGIRDFLEVAFNIRKKMKNVKFLLVGNGPQLNWAKEAVKVLGMEKNFVFPGWQKNVWPYLEKMDVFLFPTLLEGLSLALLEVMVKGIPIVARDIGGNRELVVNGKTGYLFKEEPPEKIAEIIVGLLKDKKKREAMGKAARERVKKYFNEERWIKELHKVFEEVVRK